LAIMADAGAQPQEVELKLAVASPSARAAAEHETGSARPRLLETIYYDTPQRHLQRAGYSLRLRRDGDRWSQSLKALDGFTRFESEQSLRAGAPDLSLLEGTPANAIVGLGAPPAPVFVTRVARRSRRRDVPGANIEFSLDEGEIVVRDRTWPISELELELKAGDPQALFSEGRRLASHVALSPTFLSKAERGFALADGVLGEPARFGERPLAPDTAALDAFKILSRRCARQLSVNAELVRETPRLECLHQARTALRRLRVAMSLFKAMLDHARLEAIKAEARWLTGELAEARNLDVLIAETYVPLADDRADRDGTAQFGHALLAAQAAAHERARLAVGSARFRMLLIDCAAWIESEPTPGLDRGDDAQAIAGFAAAALEKRRHALTARLESLDWKDSRARHGARIAAKKMRYAAEFFVDLGPAGRSGAYGPFITALESLQDRLGRLNDLAVAEALIPTLIADAGAPQQAAYAAGLMLGGELARNRKRLRKARAAANDFVEAPRWWRAP
jgi:inorganic triphosphatase YgiF